MKDCGTLKYCLGIKIDYHKNAGIMKLLQVANIDRLLEKFGMADCNSSRTPMEKGQKLGTGDAGITEPYRELLSYHVKYMGRFQQDPGHQRWIALKRIVWYLQGTKNLVLTLKRNEQVEQLVGFADADWAVDIIDRKSVKVLHIQGFWKHSFMVKQKTNNCYHNIQ